MHEKVWSCETKKKNEINQNQNSNRVRPAILTSGALCTITYSRQQNKINDKQTYHYLLYNRRLGETIGHWAWQWLVTDCQRFHTRLKQKNNHTSMNNCLHRALPISNPQLAAHNSIPHIKLQISRPLKALDNILLIKCSWLHTILIQFKSEISIASKILQVNNHT